jgi:signal transduction histidine kinase
VHLQGDAQALRSAIRNLQDNAVKYGGKHVELTVQPLEGGGWRVDDDGPGIPPEQRERVFDGFQRREAREVEGSGLGLAIVRAVARRHGATVTLKAAALRELSIEVRSASVDLPGSAISCHLSWAALPHPIQTSSASGGNLDDPMESVPMRPSWRRRS